MFMHIDLWLDKSINTLELADLIQLTIDPYVHQARSYLSIPAVNKSGST